jgi:hypothetical protein
MKFNKTKIAERRLTDVLVSAKLRFASCLVKGIQRENNWKKIECFDTFD